MQTLRNSLFKPWFVGEKDWGFEIIDGEFSGVTIQVEKVSFSQSESDRVDLDYHIINKPADMELKEDDPLFVKVVELIITDILTEAVSYHEQTRNNDSSQSGQ